MKRFISTLIIGSLLILPFASQAQKQPREEFRLFITDAGADPVEVGQVTGTRVYPVGTKDRETLWVTDAGVAEALQPNFSGLNLRQFSAELGRVTELQAAGPVAESWFADFEPAPDFSGATSPAWRQLRAVPLSGKPVEEADARIENYRFIPVFSDSAGTSKKAFYSARN